MKRSPLRPGTKPLKRGGPIQVRARLERGPGPRRKKPLKKVNPERLAWLRSIQFDLQAEVCRLIPCVYCGQEPPSDPHHVSARGMGGCKGRDEHCLPACDDCHREIEQHGSSVRPLTHLQAARLVHNVLTLLLVPAPAGGEETP